MQVMHTISHIQKATSTKANSELSFSEDWSLAVSNCKGKRNWTAKLSSGRLSLVSPKLQQASAYYLVLVDPLAHRFTSNYLIKMAI